MEVPEHILRTIPVDSISSISAANILGTKYINIKSGASETTVRAGEEIPSLNTEGFDNVVQQGYAVLTSLQVTVERVDKIITEIQSGKGSIGKLLVDDTLYNHVLAIVDEVKQLADALNSNQSTFGKLIYDRELYDDFRKTLARVDSLVQGLQEGQGTAGKLLKDPAIYDEARQTVAGLHKLVDDLNAGQGTAGRLLQRRAEREAHELNTMTELAKGISKLICLITVKTGEDGKMFGAVTSGMIADQLKSQLDVTLDKLNSGQGTLGQLLVNPQMYDNLNGATRELHGLMKDFRANPKKFLRIKLAIF
jgi:phospholipid/cholesterol/gamma-HCH transport system substrate-binding protein